MLSQKRSRRRPTPSRTCLCVRRSWRSIRSCSFYYLCGLGVRFRPFPNFKYASMASTRRISTVAPSSRPHESPRVSRGESRETVSINTGPLRTISLQSVRNRMWINSTIPALPPFSCRVRRYGSLPISVSSRESSSKRKKARLEGRLQNLSLIHI